MINSEFFIFLEYHLTAFFRNNAEKELQSLWCDGVMSDVTQSNDRRGMVTVGKEAFLTAFVGKDGQDKYSLVLKLGNKSLSRIARGLEIKSCIPEIRQTEFYRIDTKKKSIVIQLL